MTIDFASRRLIACADGLVPRLVTSHRRSQDGVHEQSALVFEKVAMCRMEDYAIHLNYIHLVTMGSLLSQHCYIPKLG